MVVNVELTGLTEQAFLEVCRRRGQTPEEVFAAAARHEIAAFLDYMQTHPKALNRTLKTGAWKAALNTRFRNAAKYGAPKAATRKNTGAFASFPASIEREPQRECTEAERLAARKAGEEAYERSRQHRAFHQVGDV